MKLLLLLVSFQLHAAVELRIKTEFDPCEDFASQSSDIFCGFTGQISQLSNGNLVYPMRGSLGVTDVDGNAVNFFNAGSWFTGEVLELSNSEFLIGNWDGSLYHADGAGNLIKAYDYYNGGGQWGKAIQTSTGAIVFTTTTRPLGSGDDGIGHIYVVHPGRYLPELMMSVPAGFANRGTEIKELPNGNLVAVSDQFVHFFHEKLGMLRSTRLSLTTELYPSNPIVLQNKAVFFLAAEEMFFFYANGKLKSRYNVEGSAYSDPVQLDNGLIVFTTNKGFVYFVAPSGEIVSHQRISPRGIGSTATQLSNGLVAIGTGNTEGGNLNLYDNQGNLVYQYPYEAGFYKQRILELQDGSILAMNTKFEGFGKTVVIFELIETGSH